MPRKRRRSEAAITRENDDTETTASDTAAGSAAATSNDTVKVDAGVQTLSKSQQTRRRRKRKRDELFESGKHPKLQNVFPKEGSKFRHGNFDTHKGFQVGGAGYGGNYDEEKVFADPRVLALEPKLFKNAKVLDIGCNAGYVPIAIGEKYEPHFVLGVDIDNVLIRRARKLLYDRAAVCTTVEKPSNPATRENSSHDNDQTATNDTEFPISLPITHGVLTEQIPFSCNQDGSLAFPFNVVFRQEDFLEALREGNHSKETYDIITCWNITKWIHLNHGDEGIYNLFTGIKELLRPGGKFILQPSAWRSYKKKKHFNESAKSHYDNIALFPEDFEYYLIRKLHFHSVRYIPLKEHHEPEHLSVNNTLFVYTKSLSNPWEHEDSTQEDNNGNAESHPSSHVQAVTNRAQELSGTEQLWGGAEEASEATTRTNNHVAQSISTTRLPRLPEKTVSSSPSSPSYSRSRSSKSGRSSCSRSGSSSSRSSSRSSS